MEHRKRRRMEHKVEISTLLRIAIAKNHSRKFHNNDEGEAGIARSLAAEAMESLKNCDCAVIAYRTKNII